MSTFVKALLDIDIRKSHNRTDIWNIIDQTHQNQELHYLARIRVDQHRQIQQILNSQSRTAGSNNNEWIKGQSIGKPYRNGMLIALIILVINSGLPPHITFIDILERLAQGGMKRVGYPNMG